MRTLLAAGLCAMSMVAIADATTYICTDVAGRKSIQDRPCSAGAVSSESRDTKSNPAAPFADFQRSQDARIKRIHCGYLDDAIERSRTRSNAAMPNKYRADARDQMQELQRRKRNDCP